MVVERFEGFLKKSPMMSRNVVVTPRCCYSSVVALDKIIEYLLLKQHHSLFTRKTKHFQSFNHSIHYARRNQIILSDLFQVFTAF